MEFVVIVMTVFTVLLTVFALLVGARVWWRWWNHRPSWGPPKPLSRRQRFVSRWRQRWVRIRYSPSSPAAVARRWRECRLTLRRGYSTFVLDEFDAHFNMMAASSLRYHLSPECVANNEDHREVFENLICRLEEPSPDPTPQEQAAIDTWRPLSMVAPGYENFPRFQQMRQLTDCPPAARAAFASWQAREHVWSVRQRQARHDFVDIMENLWS
jgi:hypothetical protein